MNNKIEIYYIPKNPNIKKGPIYTLYLNKNTNLDLSSILENNKTFNNIINPFKENKIIIEEKEYQKILEINNKLKKLTSEIANNINDLNKLNIEYQTLLKLITNERKI